ncbi:MAG: hypothetical protein QM723_19845 [Myxococcaceae bacterium]
MSCFEPLLAVVLLAAPPDAGTRESPVKAALEQLARATQQQEDAQRRESDKQLEALAKQATPSERPTLERLLKLNRARLPLDKQVPELASICLELLDLAKGDFESQRAALGACLAMPRLAESARLDPAPYRAEALRRAKAMVAEWPTRARAHGLLASALIDSNAGDLEVMRSLKQCSKLEPTAWCTEYLTRAITEYERPRCAGKSLVQPLTLTGARARSEGVETFYDEEPKPSIAGAEIATVMVDDDGLLAIETTAEGRKHLEEVTARLIKGFDGAMVLKLGDKPLVSARVVQTITNGRIALRAGKRLTLDELCKQAEHPKVPDELR